MMQTKTPALWSVSAREFPDAGAGTLRQPQAADALPVMSCLLGVTILVHVVLWSFGPALMVGNLHSDTLEALYWGTDWAFGYDKHPPLLSWLLMRVLNLSQMFNINPLFAELLFAQTMVAVAAFYVWRAARLYVAPAAALGGAVLLLVSPVATVFAVQMNHNSALMMFWAVAQYYALAYLERRRWSDALLLGLATGLGFLIKYELLFLIVPLVVGSLVIPRWRSAWWAPASLLAAAVALLLVVPHVVWLEQHQWPSVQRALGVQKMQTAAQVVTSIQNLVAGQLTLLGLPALMYLASQGRAVFKLATKRPAQLRLDGVRGLGLLLVAGPGLVLIAGDLVTFQVAKPLWALPLMPSTALGLALLLPPLPRFPPGALRLSNLLSNFLVWRVVRQAAAWSAGVLLLWLSYLMVSNLVGQPLVFYAARTAEMTRDVQAYWNTYQPGVPPCIVINEKRVGAAYVLWAKQPPLVVDVSTVSWNGPQRVAACQALGGVAIEADASSGRAPSTARLPNTCANTGKLVTIPGAYGPARPRFTVTLYYVPPATSPDAAPVCPAS